MIRILIVEDMTLLQETLANIVNGQEDMEVAGVTASADEALALCRKTAPDLALIDVVTEHKANGITVAAEIRREMPNIKIVIMTALPEISFIDEARKAEVHSFVYKDSSSQHLLYVIRSTMAGRGIYPGPGEEAFAKSRFSKAEISVIRLVCQGKKRNEISQTLSISEGRVKELISGILGKTGFDSITKFSLYAVANGFVVPGGSLPTEQSIQDIREDGPQKTDITETKDLAQDNVDLSSLHEFNQNIEKLSKAEAAVFTLYLEGFSAPEVAERLFVSMNTIKTHNKNIYQKLNVSSLKELMVYSQMAKKVVRGG